MSIFVDKEMRALIPSLSEEELQQLEENIVKEGIRDPLVTWMQPDGREMLIDGHNRFDISCRHNGIPFEVVRKEFADKDEAKAWIIKNQFGRRNLSSYDRSVLALKLKPLIAERAKEKQSDAGGAVRQKSDKAVIDTKKELAKIAGVSHDTIHKVETIERDATEQTKQQVRSGEKSINQAFNELREKYHKQLDVSARAHLEKVQERHDDFNNSKVVNIADAEQDRKDMAEIARAKSREITNAIRKILFIGASDFSYSIISSKTMSESEIKSLQEQLNAAILTLERIKTEIGG